MVIVMEPLIYGSGILSAMAVLVFLAASTRAGIVGIDLLFSPSLGLLDGSIVLIGACHLGDFFSLYLLLYFDMEEDTDGFLHDIAVHLVEHVVSGDLVLDKRIMLSERLQANALTQLVHIVDVIHPLSVYDL